MMNKKAHFSAVAILICAAMVAGMEAQTFTKLADVSPNDVYITTPLIQGIDGSFYGAESGPLGTFGQFFRLSRTGPVVLYQFCPGGGGTGCPDGQFPSKNIALGFDGRFYGTTTGNQVYAGGYGSIYAISPAGAFSIIHSFCSETNCADGSTPQTGLVLTPSGNFVGSVLPLFTSGIGFENLGQMFRISPTGTLTTLFTVCPNYPTDACPQNAGPTDLPVQSANGTFFGWGPGGATYAGGFYKFTSSGTPTLLFSCTAGYPNLCGGFAGLVLGTDGNFYSTYISYGGNCTSTDNAFCGSVFKLSLANGGQTTAVYNFCSTTNCTDGYYPRDLMQATDGNFYGVASDGGAQSNGVIYQLTPSGSYKVLYNFTGGTDGGVPNLALVQGTDGNLYGSTAHGGTYGYGTFFRLSVSLPPFVRTLQPAGSVGSSITIYGNNLTGATSVSFNGIAAAFSVASATRITATVPTGATTGKIQVVTPGGTLKSNASFRVLP